MIVICNFTPVIRDNYRIGAPAGGFYREVLNTDAEFYGGSNVGNQGGAWAVPEPHAGRPFHLSLKLPPLGVLYLKTPAAAAP
jgi:1,4-alpha-glucan branching enzyme